MKNIYWFLIILFFILSGCTHKSTTSDQIAQISRLIEEDSTNTTLYFERTALYSKLLSFDTGAVRKIKNDLNKILQLDPRNVAALHSKGMIIMSADKEEAVKCFTKAIKIDPDHVNSVAMRALCYMRMGKFKNSVDDWTRVIVRKPDIADNYSLRSSALIALGEYEKAIKDIGKCVELGDTSTGVWSHYLNIGELFAAMNKDTSALFYLDKAAKVSPSWDSRMLYLRGAVLMRLDNLADARRDLEKSVQLIETDTARMNNSRYSSDPAPYYHLSILYARIGLARKAGEQFDMALRNGFSDIGLLDDPRLKDNPVISDLKKREGKFKPSNEILERREALERIKKRGKALTMDESIWLGNRMNEIAVEPSKQAEYRRLRGIEMMSDGELISEKK